MSLLQKTGSYFTTNNFVALCAIGIVSFVIRMIIFPYGVPVTEDGLFYFRYATDTSILGHLPDTPISNNGWPLFLSLFFSVFHSDNFLHYMTMQRLLTVLISTSTIIPVYLLAKRFVDSKYAILAALLFAFEPRTIQNSLLGISESLYIMLVTVGLAFFLNSRKSLVYLSFSIAALAVQVRYEGIFLFFVLTIMFFVRNKKERKTIGRYLVALSIFLLTMLPFSYVKIITSGSETTTDGLISGAQVYGIEASSSQETLGVLKYIMTGIQALIKFLGLVMIPFFIFLVPVGVFLVLKNRDSHNMMLIVSIVLLLIPALYAYSRGIQEGRYLYVLYPIFSVLAVLTIQACQKKIRHTVIIAIIVVIASSMIFLSVKSTDYDHEREAFEIAKHVNSMTKVINQYYPESKYVRVTAMEERFPVLSSEVSFGPKILSPGYNTIEEFIESNREEGLDHVVVDDRPYRQEFLKDVFYNAEKYPFLIKEFDSKEAGFVYHVKIYKINYDKFDLIRSEQKR